MTPDARGVDQASNARAALQPQPACHPQCSAPFITPCPCRQHPLPLPCLCAPPPPPHTPPSPSSSLTPVKFPPLYSHSRAFFTPPPPQPRPPHSYVHLSLISLLSPSLLPSASYPHSIRGCLSASRPPCRHDPSSSTLGAVCRNRWFRGKVEGGGGGGRGMVTDRRHIREKLAKLAKEKNKTKY